MALKAGEMGERRERGGGSGFVAILYEHNGGINVTRGPRRRQKQPALSFCLSLSALSPSPSLCSLFLSLYLICGSDQLESSKGFKRTTAESPRAPFVEAASAAAAAAAVAASQSRPGGISHGAAAAALCPAPPSSS